MASRNISRTSVSTYTKSIVFDTEQRLLWAHVVYTSSADVGNRQLVLSITDGTNTYFDTHAGATQAASLTRHYEFMQGIYRETSFADDAIQVPIPKDLIIPPNFYLVVQDEGGTDSASDSFVLAYQTETM